MSSREGQTKTKIEEKNVIYTSKVVSISHGSSIFRELITIYMSISISKKFEVMGIFFFSIFVILDQIVPWRMNLTHDYHHHNQILMTRTGV